MPKKYERPRANKLLQDVHLMDVDTRAYCLLRIWQQIHVQRRVLFLRNEVSEDEFRAALRLRHEDDLDRLAAKAAGEPAPVVDGALLDSRDFPTTETAPVESTLEDLGRDARGEVEPDCDPRDGLPYDGRP